MKDFDVCLLLAQARDWLLLILAGLSYVCLLTISADLTAGDTLECFSKGTYTKRTLTKLGLHVNK